MTLRLLAHVPVGLLVAQGYFFQMPLVRLWGGLRAEAMACRN